MGERIGFVLYQTLMNRGKVGYVFWLQWCWGGLGGPIGPGWGGVKSVFVVSLHSLY